MDELIDRIGESGAEDRVMMLHPQESTALYEWAQKLEKRDSRNEWVWLIVVLSLYLWIVFSPVQFM